MDIDINEAKRLIMLAVKNNPSGVGYPHLDGAFVRRMPDMIIGGYGNKLIPLLEDMVNEGIIQRSGHGFIKGPDFPEDF